MSRGGGTERGAAAGDMPDADGVEGGVELIWFRLLPRERKRR